MSRIDTLLEESYALKRTRESWPRHVEIQAEIMQLCRNAADLHSKGKPPYWADDDDTSNDHRGDDRKGGDKADSRAA